MKSPRKSSKKKKQKEKEVLRSPDYIDLSSSPAAPERRRRASSNPFSSDDEYNVPDSPIKKSTIVKPKASSTKTRADRLVTLSPLRAEDSPSKSGGTLTRFLDKNAFADKAPNIQTSLPVQNKPTGGLVTDQRRSGTGFTGPQDDKQTRSLAQSQGKYRGPSMRRDSGMVVETPHMVRKELNMIKDGTRHERPTLPDFTYQAPRLPLFSSNNFDPPGGPRAMNNPYGLKNPPERRGDVPPLNIHRPAQTQRPATIGSNTNPENNQVNPSTAPERPALNQPSGNPGAENSGAIKQPQENQDVARRTFSIACKTKTLETCLSLKDEYLGMLPSPLFEQKPFWNKVLEKLESNLITQGKFKGWKDLKYHAEIWCQPRRTNLREGNLPAVSQGQPELDNHVDMWNKVFVQRFCTVHRGYFESAVWPLAKDKVSAMVKAEVESWISNSSKKRRDELERFARPTLLGRNSSLEDYDNAVKRLQNQFMTSQRDTAQVFETEAIMSLVMELQPGLERTMLQLPNNNRGSINATAQDNDHKSSSPHQDRAAGIQNGDITYPEGNVHRERVNFIIPSVEARTPVKPPANMARPRTEGHESREYKIPETTRLTQSSPVLGEDGPSRKRKNPEPSHGSPATPGNLAIRNKSEELGHGAGSTNDPSKAQSKRPRVDNGGYSDLPPSSDFSLRGRNTQGPRSPPPLLGYGYTRSENQTRQGNSHGNPPEPRGTGRPATPPWARDAPSRQRPSNPTWSSYTAPQPPRYPDTWMPEHDRRHESKSMRFRENTMEFGEMTPGRQNMSLREDIKELKNALKENQRSDRSRTH
ncbi:hypothetical protein FSARC_1168 [Fusarium sarcochroum]|uniref:Uncharacterized protein n=1 Tax=Fusarium sarcochroum TaxID=1208366 RepID=A0A8H4U989_9HYPO|nr:hypothetical protein FSARC_1168 [Fusarium sarcochroum]